MKMIITIIFAVLMLAFLSYNAGKTAGSLDEGRLWRDSFENALAIDSCHNL